MGTNIYIKKKKFGKLFYFLSFFFLFIIKPDFLFGINCLTENCLFNIYETERAGMSCCFSIQKTDPESDVNPNDKILLSKLDSFGECETTGFNPAGVVWTDESICGTEGIFDFVHDIGTSTGEICGSEAGECRGEAVVSIIYDENEQLCTECNALKWTDGDDSAKGVWEASVYGGVDTFENKLFFKDDEAIINTKLVGGTNGTCCGDDPEKDNPDYARNFCYTCKSGDNKGNADIMGGYAPRMWYPEATFSSEDDEAFEFIMIIKITDGEDTGGIDIEYFDIYKNEDICTDDVCDVKTGGWYSNGTGGIENCQEYFPTDKVSTYSIDYSAAGGHFATNAVKAPAGLEVGKKYGYILVTTGYRDGTRTTYTGHTFDSRRYNCKGVPEDLATLATLEGHVWETGNGYDQGQTYQDAFIYSGSGMQVASVAQGGSDPKGCWRLYVYNYDQLKDIMDQLKDKTGHSYYNFRDTT